MEAEAKLKAEKEEADRIKHAESQLSVSETARKKLEQSFAAKQSARSGHGRTAEPALAALAAATSKANDPVTQLAPLTASAQTTTGLVVRQRKKQKTDDTTGSGGSGGDAKLSFSARSAAAATNSPKLSPTGKPTASAARHSQPQRMDLDDGGHQQQPQYDADPEMDAATAAEANWVPPKNQSGDGTTSLNKRFGY